MTASRRQGPILRVEHFWVGARARRDQEPRAVRAPAWGVDQRNSVDTIHLVMEQVDGCDSAVLPISRLVTRRKVSSTRGELSGGI